jgi:hypothetical protein
VLGILLLRHQAVKLNCVAVGSVRLRQRPSIRQVRQPGDIRAQLVAAHSSEFPSRGRETIGQLPADFFNVLNHTNWDGGGTTIGGVAAPVIGSALFDPRTDSVYCIEMTFS